jgi:hypothetical protein
MMKKKFFSRLVSILFLLVVHPSVNAIVDPQGDNSGPVDLLSAEAEVYDRGDVVLLKISIEASPNLPAVIIFESDVDNSTGTGGSMSTIGTPVPPCPCKTEPGFDVVVTLFTRQQGDSSTSAIAASCADNQGECGRRRESGEWYAITSLGGQPVRAIGILRAYLDPTPHSPATTETEDCYTFPWSHIVAYANRYQQETTPGDPKNFDFEKARADNYADGKWQVSIFYDDTNYATDEDDVASGVFPSQTFDINDYAPDTGKADTIDSGGAPNPSGLTYCEGNFDGDLDVDGSDAATFKSSFGRSMHFKVCPSCCEHY